MKEKTQPKHKTSVMFFVGMLALIFLPTVSGRAQSDTASKSADTTRDIPTPTPISAGIDSGSSVPAPGGLASVSATAVPATVVSTPLDNSRPTSPGPTVSVRPNATPEVLETLERETDLEPNDGGFIYGAIAALIVGVAGLVGYGVRRLKTDNSNQRCDSIKKLLEQKKKELVEMARNWPEEKVKELVKDEALTELRQDESVGEYVKAAEDIKKEYDNARSKYENAKLAIDLLERRYDLCRLSLPKAADQTYQGIIVENSLTDKEILKNLTTARVYQAGEWNLYEVSVSKKQIEKLGECLDEGPWYMHFWQENKDDVVVVFKDKSFKIKYSDKSTWAEAIQHGQSRGISREQLDFSVQ